MLPKRQYHWLITFMVSIAFVVFHLPLAAVHPPGVFKNIYRQKMDTSSKAYKINKKVEKAMVYIPVPLYSYSQEAGHVFGLAKFNLVDFFKDSLTMPSKFAGVYTQSSKGRVNFSLSADLIMRENKFIYMTYINYKKTPEYVLGIGNDVKAEDVEEISQDRFKYYGYALFKIVEHLYVGGGVDMSSYFNLKVDSNSILIKEKAIGIKGGIDVGAGLAAAWDSRDYRYNTRSGSYLLFTSAYYSSALGSTYPFFKATLDARKFITPWFKHTIAMQVTTEYNSGDVPFYDLAMLGGDQQMRGYYKGALRDKVLVDGQIEYRMPIWAIFGVAAWVGTGRVAQTYNDLGGNDKLWLSYGLGLRIKVDSKHDTNLRLDYGRGYGNISGFYVGFAEAF